MDVCWKHIKGTRLLGNELGQSYTKFTADQCTSDILLCAQMMSLSVSPKNYLNDHLMKFYHKN